MEPLSLVSFKVFIFPEDDNSYAAAVKKGDNTKKMDSSKKSTNTIDENL